MKPVFRSSNRTRGLLLGLLVVTLLIWFLSLPRFNHGVRPPATAPYHSVEGNAPRDLQEAFPFSALTKHGSASVEMKQYFDHQRRILASLRTEPEAGGVRLAAMGDLMRMTQPQTDALAPSLRSYLAQFDLLTANLETLISPRQPVPPDSLFLMNSDPVILDGFRGDRDAAPKALLSLANNHILDFSDETVYETLQQLEQDNIRYHGIARPGEARRFELVERSGIRIGYYAATTFVNDMPRLDDTGAALTPLLDGMRSLPFYFWKPFAEIDLTDLRNVIADMRAAGVDLTVISLHWGREHVLYPDPLQVDIAHALVQAGADLVIGAHTHVPQPAEVCFVNGYETRLAPALADDVAANGCRLQGEGSARKGLILYSLGNARSYSLSFWQQLGTVAELQLNKRDGVTDWNWQGFTFTYDAQVQPPNGPRQWRLLGDHLQAHCADNECPDRLTALAAQAERHMQGTSLSEWEERHQHWLSLSDSVNRWINVLAGNTSDLFPAPPAP